MDELAYSLLILSLTNNVLRQVNEEDTAAEVWTKLESLYITKTLTNEIYLKEKLFGFKIDSSKILEENLDDFNVITIGLSNINEKISNENQAIILLNYLVESYREVKTIIKYGRTSMALEDALSALRSRDIIEIKKKHKSSFVKGLYVKNKSNKKSHSRSKSESKSQSKGKKNSKPMTCQFCKKECHLKKNCPSSQKDYKQENVNLSNRYESGQWLCNTQEFLEDLVCNFDELKCNFLLGCK